MGADDACQDVGCVSVVAPPDRLGRADKAEERDDAEDDVMAAGRCNSDASVLMVQDQRYGGSSVNLRKMTLLLKNRCI